LLSVSCLLFGWFTEHVLEYVDIGNVHVTLVFMNY